jgi:hypothetical protein
MDLETIRSVLAWCSVINLGIILCWFLLFVLAHNWIYRLHDRWFAMPVEKFNAIHYAAMAVFKCGIFLFNLVPYLALRIVG